MGGSGTRPARSSIRIRRRIEKPQLEDSPAAQQVCVTYARAHLALPGRFARAQMRETRSRPHAFDQHLHLPAVSLRPTAGRYARVFSTSTSPAAINCGKSAKMDRRVLAGTSEQQPAARRSGRCARVMRGRSYSKRKAQMAARQRGQRIKQKPAENRRAPRQRSGSPDPSAILRQRPHK